MKIGDKISVIDENLSGIIVSIFGNRVIFSDEHGFEHQYTKGKLVLQNHSIYENIRIQKKAEMPKNISKKHNKKHQILDLHFEKIVSNPSYFNSAERLAFQKEKLLKTLAFCRKNNLKKLEIIHGIGDGTLQNMVYTVLKKQTGLDFHDKEILHHQSGSVIVEFS
jgi:hypothetical protein